MKRIPLFILPIIIVLSLCSCDFITTVRVDDSDRTTVVAYDTARPEETFSAPETTEKPEEETTALNAESSFSGSFENCLFIGDSRTVGLRDNTGLPGATVFASVGLNVFRVNEDAIEVEGIGEIKLTELLEENSYDKIYIMLGINEIGYNLDYVIREYGKAVNTVKEAQPGAQIYIMANLHIVKTRSDTDEIYTNENLDYLNEGMEAFCDGDKIKYLDVNPLFDDDYGCLKQEYAFDDFHLYPEYYPQWAQWIEENS